MKLIAKWSSMLVLCLGSMAASAGAVVYDFTGVVTSEVGASGSIIGEAVTGTFSFIYNDKDDRIGSLGYGGAPWVIGSSGIPYNPVFRSKIKIGSFVYKTSMSAPNSDPDDASSVAGNAGTFTASEATPAFDLYSYMTIVSGGEVLPFTGGGYPAAPLSAGETAVGGLLYGAVSITFTITSLSPAPAASAED